MHFLDSHCHLDFPNFEKDFDEILARAKFAGVTKFVNPGVNLSTSKKAVALAEKFPQIFAAVGFHPSEAEKMSADNFTALEKLAKSKKVVAVGEIGLDFFRGKILSPRKRGSPKIQIEVFRKQLFLAQKLNLPVIIHSRNADAKIFAVLDEFENLRGVLHCFGGDWSFAEQILNRGFLIGLTGIVTFPNAKNVREVAEKIPLEKLLVETDSPFLAPQKFRGERCEPSFVVEVAREIAKSRGIEISEIAKKTTENAERLFQI